jgi:hypothetical protein
MSREWNHPRVAATGSTDARGTPADGRGGGRWQRIAVLLEPGRSGVAAVERAVAIAREHEAALVLVALAPQADALHCSAPAKGVNDAIFETVAGELAAATERIGRTGSPASSALLVDGRDPALHRWVREHRVDLVLLPARRPIWVRRRHPAARRLRRHSGAQVRVIAP